MRVYISIIFVLYCFELQGQEQSIYYNNLDGIEFQVLESGVKFLTITFNDNGKIVKLNFAKTGEREFVFTTVDEDGIGKTIELTEVNSLMPLLIKKLNKRHPETSTQKLESIIKMVY